MNDSGDGKKQRREGRRRRCGCRYRRMAEIAAETEKEVTLTEAAWRRCFTSWTCLVLWREAVALRCVARLLRRLVASGESRTEDGGLQVSCARKGQAARGQRWQQRASARLSRPWTSTSPNLPYRRRLTCSFRRRPSKMRVRPSDVPSHHSR